MSDFITKSINFLQHNPAGHGLDYDVIIDGKLAKADPFVTCCVDFDETDITGVYECEGFYYHPGKPDECFLVTKMYKP